MKFFLVFIITITIKLINSKSEECDKAEAVKQFKLKTILDPYPSFNKNPYDDQSDATKDYINKTLSNNTIVCAIQYKDEHKQFYQVDQFPSKEHALAEGYIVTHQGPCGACSNLQDLAVYMSTNLTNPVRKCGLYYSTFSRKWTMDCLIQLGFSQSCAEIWYFNTINTKKDCFWTCIYSFIINEPLNKPDGSLNNCIQCDEDKSGPYFKFYSGRTRRNSGIRSEIDRPDQQVYNITHCYY